MELNKKEENVYTKEDEKLQELVKNATKTNFENSEIAKKIMSEAKSKKTKNFFTVDVEALRIMSNVLKFSEDTIAKLFGVDKKDVQKRKDKHKIYLNVNSTLNSILVPEKANLQELYLMIFEN